MNNLLDTKECRICLSDDLIENMISPCLCTGTNKYVHHECLKKFMVLSDNPLFKKECYICKYEYNYELKDINCTKCNIILFISNIILASLILLYILSTTVNLLYSIMITFFVFLPFLANLMTVKRKSILLKLYYKQFIFLPLLLLFSGMVLLEYDILKIYGYYFENISIFMIWNIHYKCINELNRFEHFKILSINNV